MEKVKMINNNKTWNPIQIASLFNTFINGKAKGRNHLTEVDEGGIAYIGATNRNDGVMCFVAEDSTTGKLIQEGNCIGFIRNGDGAAGYAIYRGSEFISTSDVIYGYGDWINKGTGLFFVVSQDKIKPKYSHGHKRSPERLARDFVMLPVNDSGKPDYQYMAEYISVLQNKLLESYRIYLLKQLDALGDFYQIVPANKKQWKTFSINEVFSISAGKRLETRNKCPGDRPFIGATDNNNGVTGFVSNNNASRDSNVLGVNYNGAPCIAFYHPYECIFTDDVKRLHLLHYKDNKFVFLFLVAVFAKQRSKFSYGYKFNEQRMLKQKLMLPIDETGNPDYVYMEQYAKNIMIQKYNQYLNYINQ